MVPTAGRPCVFVRPVALRDCLSIWRIRNEPTVRANSMEREPIPLLSHLRWFLQRWRHRTVAPFCVAVVAGHVVGYLRLDPAVSQDWLVSIALTPTVRGQGVGRALLSRAQECATATSTILRAKVLPHNQAAQRFFERCGFLPGGDNLTWTYEVSRVKGEG